MPIVEDILVLFLITIVSYPVIQLSSNFFIKTNVFFIYKFQCQADEPYTGEYFCFSITILTETLFYFMTSVL